VTKLNYSTV